MQWPGLFFMAYGIYCLVAIASGPEGHLWCFRGRVMHSMLGPKGARILFAVIGAFFLGFGVLVLFGVIRRDKDREQAHTELRVLPATRLPLESLFRAHTEPPHSLNVSAVP